MAFKLQMLEHIKATDLWELMSDPRINLPSTCPQALEQDLVGRIICIKTLPGSLHGDVYNEGRYIGHIVSLKHQDTQSSSCMLLGTPSNVLLSQYVACLAEPGVLVLHPVVLRLIGCSVVYCLGQHMGSHRA